MRRLIKKSGALLIAVLLSVCSVIGNFSYAADEEEKVVNVVYDFVLDKSAIKPKKSASIEDFAPTTAIVGKYIRIPSGEFESETHNFSGWTVDGVVAYYSGESIHIPKDYEGDTLTVKAVWRDYDDKRLTRFTYNLEVEGQVIERPEWLRDVNYYPGMIYEPEYAMIEGDMIFSNGLMLGDRVLPYGTKLVVPEEDVELKPLWRKRILFTFYAGDVDRINGNNQVVFDKVEGGKDELAEADRFSRSGFNLVGWESSLDGQIYKPGQTVTIPSEHVTFTAVWEPKNYNVVFKTGNGGEKLKVPGITDTTIICPDPEYTVEGMTFAGWKDSEGVVHAVGSEYLIKGAIPGSGIVLTGVWTNGSEPPVTTAPPVTTTTPTGTKSTISGDANCDGVVSIADAAAIFQALGNSDKYKLSEQGAKNADVDGKEGITAADADAIQKFNANVINKLPVEL